MSIKDKAWEALIKRTLELDETACSILYDSLNGAAKDTLNACVEKGPLWAGDLPSKSGRDYLLEAGFVCQVVVNGEEGFTAATYLGFRVYKYSR